MKIFVIFFTICFLQQFSTIFAAPKLEVRQLLEQTSVISGKELRGVLHLKNSGDEPLKIGGVRSSCGCTTIRLKQRLIPPNGKTELRFVVDTRGKLGLVEKTITLYTNAPDSPYTETVHFHALPSGMKDSQVQAVFEAPCAECHIDSGIGKSGKVLYEAVCAMCHPNGVLSLQAESLQTLISLGNVPVGMPAYGEYLTKAQILSLTRFLTQKQTQ